MNVVTIEGSTDEGLTEGSAEAVGAASTTLATATMLAPATTAASTNGTSVLVISTSSAETESFPLTANARLLKTSGGETSIGFTVNHQNFRSCSLTWKNRHLIFGGNDSKKQIVEVIGCNTTRIGSLEFEFENGICCTAQDQIYLGFAIDFPRELRSTDDPLSSFGVLANSTYSHYQGNRAAANSSKLIFVIF